MPVKSTLPLDFTADIKAFFSGSNNFSDYYRGGPYVPDLNVNAAISATAAGLSMASFLGADLTSSLVVGNWNNVVGTISGTTQNVTFSKFTGTVSLSLTLSNVTGNVFTSYSKNEATPVFGSSVSIVPGDRIQWSFATTQSGGYALATVTNTTIGAVVDTFDISLTGGGGAPPDP